MSIKTTLSQDGSAINFAISGLFDINISLKMKNDINKIGSSVKIIRIDCQDVTGLDSSVFSSLLLIYEKNSSARLELVNCDRALAHRFSLAGLDRLLTIRLSSSSGSKTSTDAEQLDQSKNHQ